MPYPHGPTCQCPPLPQDAGLLAYTVDCDHYQSLNTALAEVAVLRVLTTDPKSPSNLVQLSSAPAACDETMTCTCNDCTKDRAKRIRQGVRDHATNGIPIKRRAA